jgi:hypothetical protein
MALRAPMMIAETAFSHKSGPNLKHSIMVYSYGQDWIDKPGGSLVFVSPRAW